MRKRPVVLAGIAGLVVASGIGLGVASASTPGDGCAHYTQSATNVQPLKVDGVVVGGTVTETQKIVTDCPGWTDDTTHATRDVKNVPAASLSPLPH